MEDVVSKGRGRPKKDILEKKTKCKTIRMNSDDDSMLYYLKGKFKMSENDTIRAIIKRVFNEEIRQ